MAPALRQHTMSDERPPPVQTRHAVMERLAATYRVPAGHYDELFAGPDALREHWRAFSVHAGELTARQIATAQSRVDRQIRDNGVTYNVYADTEGHTRPWALDVLPQIVPAAEWTSLSHSLAQRARLLDRLAADIYGPQQTVAGGLVPPALVYAHPGFLRACHGVQPPGGIFLHHVAFDLTRDAGGSWRVVATRAQAPSGAGYALENRLVISRLFPDAFRELGVQRLAPWFRTLQEMLRETAPADGEVPHVVLLTPGPYNETYFEHAYLARYLGFTLAEGGDLTVRGERVYLKTVSGLRRVHAVLRRMDDDFCDPLELRPDSAIGIPGLVDAWRAGHVLIANAFGVGVLESPALQGFLPRLCEHLLGEPLELPSIPTWWCGEAAARADAAGTFATLVVKPALPDDVWEPVRLSDLDDGERSEWRARIEAAPDRYVLETDMPLSHAPVWSDGRIESRSLMLRVYLVADGRGGYRAMPGGLSRIAGSQGDVVSGQRGGSSKDTWVLSDAPVERVTLLPGRLGPDDVAQRQRVVSSRAAEHLFWLGRYAERSENCARLLRSILTRLTDGDGFAAGLAEPAIRIAQAQGLLGPDARLAPPDVARATKSPAPVDIVWTPHMLEHALIDALFDPHDSRSLAFDILGTVRAAGAVRERLSSDNWRLLNRLMEVIAEPPAVDRLAGALDLIDQAIVTLVAVGGLEMAHMTRDDGWRFLSLGRHLERVLSVTTAVGEIVSSGCDDDPAVLDWLLDLSDSVITYRARHMRQPEWLAVMDLVLFDETNPRSATFQLGKLAKHVQLLPAGTPDGLVETLARLATVRGPGGDQRELFDRTSALEAFLRSSEQAAVQLSDALTLRYFSHVYQATRATSAM